MRSVTEEQAKELVDLVRMKVWAFTRGRNNQDTDDIVQDVLTRVLEQLPRFNADRASLRTFQNRLIERAYVDHLRREQAAKRGRGRVRCSKDGHDLEVAAFNGHGARQGGTGSRSQFELSELALDLKTAASTLTPEQQRLCHQVTQKPLPEIAHDLGVVRGTIYRRLRPIREAFESLDLAAYLD
jgi:RNA polymerase sigma factor (sigma-70 family)